jgi:hypothetical protein
VFAIFEFAFFVFGQLGAQMTGNAFAECSTRVQRKE